MKIYVSDKEIDDNNLNYVEDDWREEYWLSRGQSYGRGFEICDDVGLVEIQSLEQQEAELLKDFATVLANRWQLNVDVDFDHEIELRCELEKLLKERGVK